MVCDARSFQGPCSARNIPLIEIYATALELLGSDLAFLVSTRNRSKFPFNMFPNIILRVIRRKSWWALRRRREEGSATTGAAAGHGYSEGRERRNRAPSFSPGVATSRRHHGGDDGRAMKAAVARRYGSMARDRVRPRWRGGATLATPVRAEEEGAC